LSPGYLQTSTGVKSSCFTSLWLCHKSSDVAESCLSSQELNLVTSPSCQSHQNFIKYNHNQVMIWSSHKPVKSFRVIGLPARVK